MALDLEVHGLADIVDQDAEEHEVVQVARAIVRTVQPQSWETLGGNGRIAAVRPFHDKFWRLAVLSEHQADVRDFLSALRQ